jgi:hypothetical protein
MYDAQEMDVASADSTEINPTMLLVKAKHYFSFLEVFLAIFSTPMQSFSHYVKNLDLKSFLGACK